jgi:hypothetical protein
MRASDGPPEAPTRIAAQGAGPLHLGGPLDAACEPTTITRHRRRGGRGHLRHSEGSATSPRTSTHLSVTRSLSRRRVAGAAVLQAAGYGAAWRVPPVNVSRRFAPFSFDYPSTSAAPLRPQQITSANVDLDCVWVGTHGLLLESCGPVSRLSLLLRASVRRHRRAQGCSPMPWSIRPKKVHRITRPRFSSARDGEHDPTRGADRDPGTRSLGYRPDCCKNIL